MNIQTIMVQYVIFMFVLGAISNSPLFPDTQVQTPESANSLYQYKSFSETWIDNILRTDITSIIAGFIIFSMLIYLRAPKAALYGLFLAGANSFIQSTLNGHIPNDFITMFRVMTAFIVFLGIMTYFGGRREEEI